jgi:hypothetical protein
VPVEILAQITSDNPPFTAGLVLHDDDVVEAAPIIRYMQRGRWTRAVVRDYCERRGWQIKVVRQQELNSALTPNLTA